MSLAGAVVDPFKELKDRLAALLAPSELDQCTSIWRGGGAKLGGRRPTELLEVMMAALPLGKPAGNSSR